MKKRLINFAVTLGTCLVLLLIYLIVFNRYKKSLSGYEYFSQFVGKQTGFGPLSPYDVVQLGKVHHDKDHPASSYLNFPPKKAEGKFRIGIFGCSFVRGMGAGYGYDFPSRLQEKYEGAGKDEVEVINFGVASYGMNRSFYMWNSLGKTYDLDIVIFNIHSFHRDRDDIFIFDENSYGPVHGRYAIENKKLTYIPVTGETREEASAHYYSSFPAWQYWKYESKTPVPFRALLPKGKKLKRNPFYYHPNPDEEWEALTTAIFDSVAKQAPRLIIAFGSMDIKDNASYVNPATENIDKRQVEAYHIKSPFPSIYKSMDGHPNALGYQLIAEELFDYLEGRIEIDLPFMMLDTLSFLLPAFHVDWGPLSEVKKLYTGIQGKELAVFTTFQPGNWQLKKKRFNPVENFTQKNIQSLIGIPVRKEHFFVPSRSKLSPQTDYTLTLHFTHAGAYTIISLGKITPQTSFWGVMDDPKLSFTFEGKGHRLSQIKEDVYIEFSPTSQVTNLTIQLEEEVLLRGKKSKGNQHVFELVSPVTSLLWLRGSENQKIDLHKIDSIGKIDLMAEYKSGEVKSLPFVGYKVENMSIESSQKNSSWK